MHFNLFLFQLISCELFLFLLLFLEFQFIFLFLNLLLFILLILSNQQFHFENFLLLLPFNQLLLLHLII